MPPDPAVARDAPARPQTAPAHTTGLFFNQFTLGPSCPEALSGWPGVAIGASYWLATHPELAVTRVVGDKLALTLVGFMLDPNDPVADDGSILARLLERSEALEQVIDGTSALGGRWLLIAECGEATYVLPDALGLRQALYTEPSEASGTWVMSQSGLASEFLGLARDERASEFLDSYPIRAARPEYYWPGMSTPLRGLRHLLPNHVLELRSGQVSRCWPSGPLPCIEREEAVGRIGAVMSGLLCAAAARFELALSITAGIDSRLVLAAARPIQDQISYVTVRQAKMSDDSADLQVPARLLDRLGLAHEIVRAPGSMSADFSWTFKRNVFLARDHYGTDAEAILAHFGRQKVAVTGSGAEVGRCATKEELPLAAWRGVSAAQLARMEGMCHPYAIRCFLEWLDDVDAGGCASRLDLFEWEQGHGRWLAATQLEFDCAWRDILTPYNCRALLVTMLGVRERYRREPECALFRDAALRLWPEVMDEPVNPHKYERTWRRWRRRTRRALRACLPYR